MHSDTDPKSLMTEIPVGKKIPSRIRKMTMSVCREHALAPAAHRHCIPHPVYLQPQEHTDLSKELDKREPRKACWLSSLIYNQSKTLLT